MKKTLLIGTALATNLIAVGFDFPENVSYQRACLSLGISPNGKWMGNLSGYAKVYDVENDVMTEYSNCTLSQGSTPTNDGVAVAGGVFLKDGEIIPVQTTDGKGGFDVNAITADGKYITGSWGRGPFVGELNEDLEVVNAVRLPYPETDLFGEHPQWVQALIISEDGNTVAGQIQDSYGMYLYPIIFYNTSEGWEYSIPIMDVFNPNEVEILRNPTEQEKPDYPYPEDFMSQGEAAIYQEAYRAYVAGSGNKPDPVYFMTPEEYQAYMDAVDAYNEWYYNMQDSFNRFLENYYAIVESSPSFNHGELAIHPSGEYIYMNGGINNSFGQQNNFMYEFTKDGINRKIPLLDNNQAPLKVLSDGTLLSSPPLMAGFNGFLLEPGAEEFITLIEYLARDYPEMALWVDETFPGGTGTLSMSDDKKTIAGSVFETQLCDELRVEVNYRFATYIIRLDPAGVEGIEADMGEGLYRVYNLQGVKVLETKDASTLNSLRKGLYIINGKKVMM